MLCCKDKCSLSTGHAEEFTAFSFAYKVSGVLTTAHKQALLCRGDKTGMALLFASLKRFSFTSPTLCFLIPT